MSDGWALLEFLVAASIILTPILLVVTLWKLSHLLERVNDLATRVRRPFERSAWETRPDHAYEEPPVEPAPLTDAAPPVVATEPPIQTPPPLPEPPPPPRTAAAPVLDESSEPVREVVPRSQSNEDLESAIGQKWLVRIGALVLVTGAGFFYAYAIERGWVSLEARAIGGGVVGLALMALGVVFQRRGFLPLAQGFAGCGAGMLFLDVYATHRFYDLIDSNVALALTAVVAVITGVVAFRWSAMPLALLAQLGGYSSPVFLQEAGPDRAKIVLAYVFVVSAGALTVAALKHWRPVTITAAVASVATLVSTPLSWPHVTNPALITGWAAAYALLFLIAGVASAAARRRPLSDVFRYVIPVIAVTAAFVIEKLAHLGDPDHLALAIAGLALAHAVAAELLARRSAADTTGIEIVRAVGAALVIDALRFPFEGTGHTAALGAAGVVFALAATFRQSIAFRAAAAVAFGIAVAFVMRRHLHSVSTLDIRPFLNLDFVVGAGVTIAIAACALLDRATRWIGLSTAALAGAIVLAGEINLAVRGIVDDPASLRAFARVTHAVMAAAVMTGFAMAVRTTKHTAVILLAMLTGIVAFTTWVYTIQVVQRPPQTLFLLNVVFLGALAFPIALLSSGKMLRGAFGLRAAYALSFSGAVFVLVVLSFEAHRFFARVAEGASLVDAASAAVSVTWATYAALLLTVGIAKRLRLVRMSALVLLAITLAKVAMHDLSELDRLARILSFIALGVVMMTGAWAYHRFGDRIFGAER